MEEVPAQETLTQQQVRKAKRPVIYETGPQGHYGECQRLVNEHNGANPDAYVGIWSNINQGLLGTYRDVLSTYWMSSLRRIEDDDHNYKEHQLPLARIKKVMKADPEVKMISAEAPILFAKGCDLFITELTMRAWIHAEENKRRTLQRSDIAAALTKSDMFDFLIDIVPREEAIQSHSKRNAAANQPVPPPNVPPPMPQHGAQAMVSHPSQHHPGVPEYGQFLPPEHDYRQPMYQQDPGYGHPQAPMGFDPNQGMYGAYTIPPQQMYQQMPRPDHPHVPPPQPHHYRPHGPGDADVDADGERDYGVG